MPPSIILSFGNLVAQRAWVGTTNRVFSFNVAPHKGQFVVGVEAEEADEPGLTLHHQALAD